MLRAYFDESGGEDTRFFLIGGLIARREVWEGIERQWRNVLLECDSPAFHAVDVAHGRGAFADRTIWPLERRERLARTLAALVTGIAPVPVLSVIDVRLFKQLVTPELTSLGVDHYIVSFLHLAHLAATIAAPDLTIHPCFAALRQYSGSRLQDLYVKSKALGHPPFDRHTSVEHFGPMTIGTPQAILPLQAADLFAYSTLRLFRRIALREEGRPLKQGLWEDIGTSLYPNKASGLVTEAAIRQFLGNERLMESFRQLAQRWGRTPSTANYGE